MAEKKERNLELYREATPSENRQQLPGRDIYEIRVKGQLDNSWSEWLEGLEVKLLEDGEMLLYGPIEDQPALMGVLYKLSNLNLNIISINKVRHEP